MTNFKYNKSFFEKSVIKRIKWHSSLVSISFLLSGGVSVSALLPTSGVVKSGVASIIQTQNVLSVNQSTDKAVIDWNSFDVGKNKVVEFIQPRSQSQILNRVLGSTPSTIAGQIQANGQVFLVNPNGLLITKYGLVDTNAFSASTLDISNQDFMNGRLSFIKKSGEAGAMVTNRGSITVDDGGFVALLGGAVDNSGVVTAHLGKIGFGAGEKVILNIGGSEFFDVEIPTSDLSIMKDVNGNKLSAMISVGKGGKVIANGGLVKLNVGTVRGALRQVVNTQGLVQAKSVSSSAGKIVIGGASVSVGGTIDASSDVDGVKGGAVSIVSRSYRQSGKIDASGKDPASNGGTVSILSDSSISMFTQSKVLADGEVDGGVVRIIADTEHLVVQGKVSASGYYGRGGLVDISTNGGNVVVMDGVNILATGQSAGGLIRIGGEFAGIDPPEAYSQELLTGFRDRWTTVFGDYLLSLPSSVKTSLGYDTLVDASSTHGDGGTVVLWSNGLTQQFGTIKANGFNNGGWVEISGKNTLKSYKLSKVKVSGRSVGTVLLDPKNLVVEKMNMISYINALFKYTLESKLKSGDNFGRSLSLIGNDTGGYKLAVGAPGDDDGDASYSGAVYLFDIANFDGANRTTFVDKLSKAHTTLGLNTKLDAGDKFGALLSLIGNDTGGYKLAVGAPGDDDGDASYSGAVYLFDIANFNTGATTFVDKLSKAHTTLGLNTKLDAGDNFGRSLSLIGNDTGGYKLAVGAPGDDDGDASDSGAVYLFNIANFDGANRTTFVDKLSKAHTMSGL